MRIDVHCHGWSEEYLDRLAAEGYKHPNLIRYIKGMGGLTTDAQMEKRYAAMDESGVELQIWSPAGIVAYPDDEGTAVEIARYTNETYAQFASEFDRVAAFATLPLPHVDASVEAIGPALDGLGLAGVQFPTSVKGLSMTDERFDPLWEELDKRAATVFYHPAGIGIHSTLLDDYNLSWLIGAPIEDTFAAVHAMAVKIPERFPNVNVIIPHCGGLLPMLLGRLDDQQDMSDNRWDPENPASTLARKLYYDVVVHRHGPGLRATVDSFGADRVVLGSDFPWQVEDRYVGGVRYVEESGLDPADAEKILDRNLDALFPALTGAGR